MKAAISIEHLRRQALRRLPRVIGDYLEGGADDEETLRANRRTFDRHVLVPRVATGNARTDLSVTLFGRKIAVPFLVGPTGMNGIFWHEGDLCLARAAAKRGTGFVLALASNCSIEHVALAGNGLRWFQFYPWGTLDMWRRTLHRAAASGYDALVLTLDTPVPGNRERDRANGFAHSVRMSPLTVIDGLLHPRWLWTVWLRGAPAFENLREAVGANASVNQLARFTREARRSDIGWSDVAAIRRAWKGPMLVKGVLDARDVDLCRRAGVDGVVVSNHGGRQLDHSISPLDALPAIRDSARDMTVLVDSGFRRGTDVVKALALGADAVLLGRSTLYGLAAGGQSGVEVALKIFEEEVRRAMELLGAGTVKDLEPAHVCRDSSNRSPLLH